MRVAQSIELTEEDRRKLEQQSRGRSIAARVILRSRIILLAAAGLQNRQIAEKLKVAPRMATLWRDRFNKQGIKGLLKDAPRPGHPPSINAELTASLIEKTTQSTPANATHWSTRTMAKEMGISKASVSRIWRAHGLKPHRVDSFKVSNDFRFAEKLEDVVGLYLNPPEHALVLSVDEKSQIQALDRTQPGLPRSTAYVRRSTGIKNG
jgi:transposase